MTGESRPRMTSAVWRRWLWALLVGAMIPLAGVYGFFLGERHETVHRAAFPVLGTSPSYTMTNQLRQEVSSNGFRGKVQIVSFLSPYCTTMCPLIAAHLANLESLGLGPAGIENQVQIVSFNLYPANTGPKEMRAFLTQYGWNPDDLHWQYLTGNAKDIHRVVTDGFGVGYQRVSASEEGDRGSGSLTAVQPEVVNKLAEKAHVDYEIVHDDALAIVDRQGRIRKTYDNADTVDWRELLSAVRSLGAAVCTDAASRQQATSGARRLRASRRGNGAVHRHDLFLDDPALSRSRDSRRAGALPLAYDAAAQRAHLLLAPLRSAALSSRRFDNRANFHVRARRDRQHPAGLVSELQASLFLFIVFHTLLAGRRIGANPWGPGATTLE